MVEWLKVSPDAIKSRCGRWRVCRVVVMGRTMFELWDRKERIGGWPTAQEAKERAK